jgi:hypothetical protein
MATIIRPNFQAIDWHVSPASATTANVRYMYACIGADAHCSNAATSTYK